MLARLLLLLLAITQPKHIPGKLARNIQQRHIQSKRAIRAIFLRPRSKSFANMHRPRIIDRSRRVFVEMTAAGGA